MATFQQVGGTLKVFCEDKLELLEMISKAETQNILTVELDWAGPELTITPHFPEQAHLLNNLENHLS